MGTVRCDYSLQLSRVPCQGYDKTAVYIIHIGDEVVTLCGVCGADILAKSKLYGLKVDCEIFHKNLKGNHEEKS